MRLIGLSNWALVSSIVRVTKASIQASGTRILEVTVLVLLAGWSLTLAIWVWVKFSPWATIP